MSIVQPGWYHMTQMKSVELGHNDDGQPALNIKLKPNECPAEGPVGFRYEWLFVQASGRAYLSDNCTQLHYQEAVDYFNVAILETC